MSHGLPIFKREKANKIMRTIGYHTTPFVESGVKWYNCKVTVLTKRGFSTSSVNTYQEMFQTREECEEWFEKMRIQLGDKS